MKGRGNQRIYRIAIDHIEEWGCHLARVLLQQRFFFTKTQFFCGWISFSVCLRVSIALTHVSFNRPSSGLPNDCMANLSDYHQRPRPSSLCDKQQQPLPIRITIIHSDFVWLSFVQYFCVHSFRARLIMLSRFLRENRKGQKKKQKWKIKPTIHALMQTRWCV